MENYLDRKLALYEKKDIYPFHMPGHKRLEMNTFISEKMDITEITGFDNLHHPEGIIKEAQERLAKTFGAYRSFFLVNGSTAGILAAISAAAPKRGRVLMARNCHKSVYNAVFLQELKTSYLYPMETGLGIQGSISPEDVRRELSGNTDISAVVITSPTYDGVVSDIESIAEIVHSFQLPLIVDEAHGAHFGFSADFPEKAISLGADYVIESLHKTLPALTQAAVIHISESSFADAGRLQRFLQIFQSTSPSYLLMGSIDRCTRILKEDGDCLFHEFSQRLNSFYKSAARLKKIEVFPYCMHGNVKTRSLSGLPKTGYLLSNEMNSASNRGIWARDPSKILISASRIGLNGQSLLEHLYAGFRIEMEMASGHYATALSSILDTDEGFRRLMSALESLEEESDEIRSKVPGECSGEVILTPTEIYKKNEKASEIAETDNYAKETLRLSECAGRVSAEYVYLYPPGIPIIAPGEVISSDVLDALMACRERGMSLQGMADLSAERLQVLA